MNDEFRDSRGGCRGLGPREGEGELRARPAAVAAGALAVDAAARVLGVYGVSGGRPDGGRGAGGGREEGGAERCARGADLCVWWVSRQGWVGEVRTWRGGPAAAAAHEGGVGHAEFLDCVGVVAGCGGVSGGKWESRD